MDETREILIRWLADATAVMEANQRIQAEAVKTGKLLSGEMAHAELATMSFTQQVDKARVSLLELMTQGHSLRSAMAGLKEVSGLDTSAINEAGKSIGDLGKETKNAEKSLFDLGNTAQRVFRSIMGFIVLNILRQILTFMGDLIDKGKEFNKVLINLSIGARAAQRSGLDITFEELVELVDRLQEKFGIFTSRELRSGIDQLVIFGKETNLTKEQILGLSDAIAAAAVVTGLDFETAINRVMRALTTGQTRGLLEAGFAITELMVKEEAYNSGLAKRGEALSDVAKQQAIFNLIMDQASKLNEEATLVQDTLVGQVIEEEAALSDLQDQLGNKLLPTKLLFTGVLRTLLTWVDKALTAFVQWSAVVMPMVGAAVWVSAEALIHFWKALSGESSPMSFEDIKKRFIEVRDVMREMAILSATEFLDPSGLGDIGESLGFATAIQKEADDVAEAGDELEDELKDLFTRLREAIISGKQDAAKENRDFFQDMFENMQKFIFKMQQAAEKYAFDVGKIWRDYRDKLTEIDQKYRDKEIKAEEDFQDKIRKLRNQFLMDLEDALHERDARQILRLIRNFNLRASELEKEREKEAKDRRREELREQQDLARQRDQRLRELKLEYDFRTQQAKDQYELERKLAWEDHVNRLQEIEIRTKERLEQLIRTFKDEHDITRDGAAAIADALAQYFGPGGQVEGIYESLLASTSNFVTQLIVTLQRLRGLGSIFGFNFSALLPDSISDLNPDQDKIDDIKDRIGTGGYSTPMGAMTALPSLYTPTIPTSTARTSSSASQRVAVEIGLSPDLVGEIVSNTLGEVADVFIKVTR